MNTMCRLIAVLAVFTFVLLNGVRAYAADAQKYIDAAEQYLIDEKVSAAAAEIVKALKADPNNAKAHDLSGFIAELNEDPDAAEKAYKKAIECDSKFHKARLHLGEFYISQERLDDAVKEFEALKKAKPDMPEAYAALGRAQILKEEYKEAENTLLNGKKTAGATAELEFLRGMACLGLGRSRFKDAVKAFEESIRLDSDYTDAYAALADVYIEDGRYTKAAEQLVQALRIEPDHVEANYLMGRVAVLRKQFPKALRHFKKVLLVDGENLETHLEIGLVYQDFKKDFKQAIFHYNKYKSLEGTDSRVDDWLAKAKNNETSGTAEEEEESKKDEG